MRYLHRNGGSAQGWNPKILTRTTRLASVEENRARRVVDTLRERGVNAHVAREGVYQIGVRIVLPDGREAQVMRDGMLVGFVPVIEGSEYFDEAQTIDAIARTDYDRPIARQRATAPPPAAPLAREGGVFRRFLG